MPPRASKTARGTGGREPLYDFVLRVLGAVSRIMFRLRVLGAEALPHSGPALLTPNHVSYLDPVLLAVIAHRRGRRLRFLATAELFERPIVGWAARVARQIPVHRGVGTAEATRPAREALAAGELVVIYPEGTIPPSGVEPRAKPGAGLVAMTCDVPVIPVALWGMHRRDGRYRLALRRRAAVVIGPPLDPGRWRHPPDKQDPQRVSDEILATVRALLPAAQRLAGDEVQSRGLPRADTLGDG